MNQKIVKTKDASAPEVLVQKCRNDEGEDYVQISAWHTTEDGELFQSTSIDFENSNSVLITRFIADFSEESANDFVSDFDN